MSDNKFKTVEEITFRVQCDEWSGWLVASWNDPDGGGITTQGQDLPDLEQQIAEAIVVHFDDGTAPHPIRSRSDMMRPSYGDRSKT